MEQMAITIYTWDGIYIWVDPDQVDVRRNFTMIGIVK